MSRSGYSDDLDYNQLCLYRRSVENAINGKRGQRFLKKLDDALEQLEEKKLIANAIVKQNNDVCALGALWKKQKLDPKILDFLDDEDPDWNNACLSEFFNIAKCMVAEIEFVNDELGPVNEKPEQRFQRVQKWVRKQIIGSDSEFPNN